MSSEGVGHRLPVVQVSGDGYACTNRRDWTAAAGSPHRVQARDMLNWSSPICRTPTARGSGGE